MIDYIFPDYFSTFHARPRSNKIINGALVGQILQKIPKIKIKNRIWDNDKI